MLKDFAIFHYSQSFRSFFDFFRQHLLQPIIASFQEQLQYHEDDDQILACRGINLFRQYDEAVNFENSKTTVVENKETVRAFFYSYVRLSDTKLINDSVDCHQILILELFGC